MYLVAIGWLYVALMMAVAEANHPNGTVLGGIVTFLFYGLLPTALVMYLMGTPLRRRANREREAHDAREEAEHLAATATATAVGSVNVATAPLHTPGPAVDACPALDVPPAPDAATPAATHPPTPR